MDAILVFPCGERLVERVHLYETERGEAAPSELWRTVPRGGTDIEVQHFVLVHLWKMHGRVSFLEYEMRGSRIESQDVV